MYGLQGGPQGLSGAGKVQRCSQRARDQWARIKAATHPIAVGKEVKEDKGQGPFKGLGSQTKWQMTDAQGQCWQGTHSLDLC